MKIDRNPAHGISVRERIVLPQEGGRTPELITFHGFPRNEEHFVLCYGDALKQRAPLVRIHSECITGDLFRSQRCDCGPQLKQAIDMAAEHGGLIVYLRQEGRGIGLYAKVDAYRLQDCGLDTFAANEQLALPRDGRRFDCAAAMLRALGVQRLRLVTNNAEKVAGLVGAGLEVEQMVPTGTFVTPHNFRYLRAKAVLARHHLQIAGSPAFAAQPA